MATPSIPLDLEAQLLESIKNLLDSIEDALGSVATDVLRVGGDQNTPFAQRATTNDLLVQLRNAGTEIDPRNIRSLTSSDIVTAYGSQTQALLQRATTYDLLVQIRHAGSEIDPRDIRALTASDVITIYGSQGVAVTQDAAGDLQIDVLSLPSLPAGTNTIGGVFADYTSVTLFDAVTVGTTEVTSTVADVRQHGRKVVWITNTQDVDITVDVDGSVDGTNWYVIRDSISIPAGEERFLVAKDSHGYMRLRAVATASPTSGSVTAKLIGLM